MQLASAYDFVYYAMQTYGNAWVFLGDAGTSYAVDLFRVRLVAMSAVWAETPPSCIGLQVEGGRVAADGHSIDFRLLHIATNERQSYRVHEDTDHIEPLQWIGPLQKRPASASQDSPPTRKQAKQK